MQTIERLPGGWNESCARLAIVAVFISGCASTRVSLGPIPPITSELDAQKVYATYRVEGVKSEELHVGRLAHSAITRIDSSVTAIVLANGVEVQDPRDLIPVVGARTTTAEAARAWARARQQWAVSSTIASVSFAVGFAGLMTSLITLGAFRTAVPALVSGAVLLLGTLVPLGVGKATLPDVSDLLVKSFRAYTEDLAVMRDSYVPRDAGTPPGDQASPPSE